MHLPINKLEQRARQAKKTLSNCSLCARECKIDRTRGLVGFCGATDQLKIAHIGLHHGEEPPISGTKGSGAIFFTHCNLHCSYCQNWQISHPASQYKTNLYTEQKLADEMVSLQKNGAHNINLISPSHYIPQIIASLCQAKKQGLTLPIVYNTNGFDSLNTLKLLEGIIDIYLPDIKYGNGAMALKYSQAPHYTETSKRAITEMFRQVGTLECDPNGIAQHGLIVRHLVLPNDIAGSIQDLEFLASVSPEIHLSLMSQYTPQYRAKNYPELNRTLTAKEYAAVVETAGRLGLANGWIQEFSSQNELVPDFNSPHPFQP